MTETWSHYRYIKLKYYSRYWGGVNPVGGLAYCYETASAYSATVSFCLLGSPHPDNKGRTGRNQN